MYHLVEVTCSTIGTHKRVVATILTPGVLTGSHFPTLGVQLNVPPATIITEPSLLIREGGQPAVVTVIHLSESIVGAQPPAAAAAVETSDRPWPHHKLGKQHGGRGTLPSYAPKWV
jgi:hypothetical protein